MAPGRGGGETASSALDSSLSRSGNGDTACAKGTVQTTRQFPVSRSPRPHGKEAGGRGGVPTQDPALLLPSAMLLRRVPKRPQATCPAECVHRTERGRVVIS